MVSARQTYVAPVARTVARASKPNSGLGTKEESGLALSEILYELRRFADTRANKSQSVVLAGVCNLAKEKYCLLSFNLLVLMESVE